MKLCPYCAEEIQEAAIVCKHCKKDLPLSQKQKRSKIKRRLVFTLITVSIIAILLLLLYNWGLNKIEPDNSQSSIVTPTLTTLERSLKYLNDIPEVSWIEFDNNTVYIGFNPRPDDLDLIIKAAALNGNKATNFGVHIWAIDAVKYSKGWRPGRGSYFKEVTARHGKLE